MNAVRGGAVGMDCTDRSSACARIGRSRRAAVGSFGTRWTLMLGRMSGQAVHGDSPPEEVSAGIGRATKAAVQGGHTAIVEMLLAFLKACGEGGLVCALEGGFRGKVG